MLRQIRRTATRAVVSTVAVVGLVEVTTQLPSQGRSSQTYHWLSDEIVTPTLRRFFDPETAHTVALECARRNLAPTYRPSAVEQQLRPYGDKGIRPFRNFPHVAFANGLGLAAGFDKDGVAIEALLRLGFGFVEIGSITPQPQPGNPQPRMFRLSRDYGIINRYGFNSLGADAVAQNLRRYRQGPPEILDTEEESEIESGASALGAVRRLASGIVQQIRSLLPKRTAAPTLTGIVGVNLGKNKTSENEIEDYCYGIQQLGPYADYLVINVSSPNTPGLRDLQEPSALRGLLTAALAARDALPKPVPLLVKLAPDLSVEELKEIAVTVMDSGVDGMVVCNTTNARPSTISSEERQEVGGLSGAPLKDRSTDCIRILYQATDGSIPIIGVGGVGSGQDAYEKLKAGASLIQIYSMMVFEGPGVVTRIRHELAELLRQNGHRHMRDVVGLEHDDIYWRKREEISSKRQEEEKTILAD